VTRASRARRIAFRCNICGGANALARKAFGREAGTCTECSSTVRWRSIVHVLSVELFGESLALPDFPSVPELTGVGLSDWDGYAVPLARKLGYTNTFLHQAPRLDITAVAAELRERFDFVLASDVFEHVPPPVSVAFENLRALLRPGGVAVVTVPYEPEGETVEHFPDLHRFELADGDDGEPELRNTTRTGEQQVFRELVFHGGPGSTLEMRVFSESSLHEELHAAGFGDVETYGADVDRWGIVWNAKQSFPVAARATNPARVGQESEHDG
jgi:SAM-dependent methyltransferase